MKLYTHETTVHKQAASGSDLVSSLEDDFVCPLDMAGCMSDLGVCALSECPRLANATICDIGVVVVDSGKINGSGA